MSAECPGESRPRKKSPSALELTARHRDDAQAKLVAHQVYHAGLNPASLKAEDARRQIKLLEEDLRMKTERANEG